VSKKGDPVRFGAQNSVSITGKADEVNEIYTNPHLTSASEWLRQWTLSQGLSMSGCPPHLTSHWHH